MKRILLAVALLAVLAPRAAADAAKAEAALVKLGGRVIRDDKAADKPVVRVQLADTKATDADLAHLKAFPKLAELTLSGTNITDAGLKHLAELKNLASLSLAK